MVLIGLLIHSSGFQRTEEALHHGVIVAIASATHAHQKLKLSQQRLIGMADILAVLIRVLQQFLSKVASTRCLPQAAYTRLSSRCAAMAQPTTSRV